MNRPRRAKRWLRPVSAAAMAVVALAGCVSLEPPTPATSASPGASATGATPREPTIEFAALIGSWVVTSTGTEELGAVLRIAPNGLSLWRGCGQSSGEWSANNHGLFVGEITSPGPACPRGTTSARNVPWLAEVVAYVPVQTGWALLRTDGTIAARLVPGGSPTPDPNVIATEADPPVATPEFRAAHQPAVPLPASLVPATHSRLVGSWVAVTTSQRATEGPRRAGFVLHADGTYTGADGCNASSGRWSVGDGGAIVATRGPTTAIGCDNVDARAWLSGAAWAAFDGDVLVLVDRTGAEAGRLTRA
jgi:heat shock protein HslJ